MALGFEAMFVYFQPFLLPLQEDNTKDTYKIKTNKITVYLILCLDLVTCFILVPAIESSVRASYCFLPPKSAPSGFPIIVVDQKKQSFFIQPGIPFFSQPRNGSATSTSPVFGSLIEPMLT